MLLASVTLLVSASIASASLQPGEVALRGKITDYDKRKKEVTFYSIQHKRDFTFKFEDRKGPYFTFNAKKISHTRYFSKQDKFYSEIIVVFQDIKDFDKANVEMKGYVIRRAHAIDEEYHEEHHSKAPSKR